MNLTAAVTILYMVVVLAIGYLTSRKGGAGVREFLVAGGNLPWVLLVPFLMAEYITASTTVGLAESAHKSGVNMLMYYIGSPLGLSLLAFVFVKLYKSLKKVTVGEVFAALFDRRTRLVCVITMLTLSTITANTASLGLATIVAPMFNISYVAAIWVSTGFMVVMAIIGLRGQAWMNIVHFVVIMVCFSALAIMAVAAAGGPVKLFASLPPEHLNLLRMGIPTTTAWIIASTGIKLISLIAVTAIFAARSETDAKIGAVSTGIVIFIFAILPILIGLSAYAIMPDISSRYALYKMGEYLGTPASVMVSVGIIAAIVSTTPGVLLSLAGLFIRDLFLLANPSCSEEKQIFFCRLAIVFIAVAGTALAYALTKTGTIWSLITKSVEVRTVIVVPLLISAVWRRVHPTAAFWAILTGVVSGFIWLIISQVAHINVEPLWPSLGVGLLTLVIISLVKKPAPYKGAEGLELAPTPEGND